MQTVWQRRVFISLGILIENIFVRFGLGFPNKTYKKRFGNQNLWFTGQGQDRSWNFGSPDWPKFVVRAWQWREVDIYKKRLLPMIGGSAGLGAAQGTWWLDLVTGMEWCWGEGQTARM